MGQRPQLDPEIRRALADYLTRRSNSVGTGVENERQPREAGSGAHTGPSRLSSGARSGELRVVAPSLYRTLDGMQRGSAGTLRGLSVLCLLSGTHTQTAAARLDDGFCGKRRVRGTRLD
jgi:hypothetical protein